MSSEEGDSDDLQDYEQYENPRICAASTSGNLQTVSTELRLWRSKISPSKVNAKHLKKGLRSAISAGHPSVVSFLLDEGAELDPGMIQVGLRGTTSMFQTFLDHGWDINQRTDTGAPALKHLVSNDAIVKWFLDHGADPTVLGSRGESILTVTAYNATPAVMNMLVSHGGEELLLKGDALHVAAKRDRKSGGVEMLTYLLDFGLNINRIEVTHYPAGRGWARGTPLHCAVKAKNAEGIRILLDRGADPDTKNTHEQTPLDLAIEREFLEGSEILKNHRKLLDRAL